MLLVTCLRGELPFSAEVVRKFGPMHVPIATKGYENLFVALANRKRVDGSTICSSEGCVKYAPKMNYLIIIIIRRLTTRAMSEYMTESEARTVARSPGRGGWVMFKDGS